MTHQHHVQLEPGPACRNLAREELILENQVGDEVVMLLYVNQGAVVIGKNQNPWKEANVPWLLDNDVPLVRRVSGGGTVWHGPGNLNFSFIGPQHLIRKEDNLLFVSRALEPLGIKVAPNERGDLILDGRKVSGNAYCHRRQRTLHHGTLLVSEDLHLLRKALDTGWNDPYCIQGGGVASVRSSVTRLSDHGPISMGMIAASIEQAWIQLTGSIPMDTARTEVPATREAIYRSHDWNYGCTPDFSACVAGTTTTIHKGLLPDGRPFNTELMDKQRRNHEPGRIAQQA